MLEQGLVSLWCSAGRIFCLADYLGVLLSEGSTLLHIASMANIQPALKVLLRKGVKVVEKDELGSLVIHYAASRGDTVNCEILIKPSSFMVDMKDTALQVVIGGGNFWVLESLPNAWADVNACAATHSFLRSCKAWIP